MVAGALTTMGCMPSSRSFGATLASSWLAWRYRTVDTRSAQSHGSWLGAGALQTGDCYERAERRAVRTSCRSRSDSMGWTTAPSASHTSECRGKISWTGLLPLTAVGGTARPCKTHPNDLLPRSVCYQQAERKRSLRGFSRAFRCPVGDRTPFRCPLTGELTGGRVGIVCTSTAVLKAGLTIAVCWLWPLPLSDLTWVCRPLLLFDAR